MGPPVSDLFFSSFQKFQQALSIYLRSLNIFKITGKIQRAIRYYLEPVVKFAVHLENILCGNISEFALLHFRALFKYLLLPMHLNFAKIDRKSVV